MTSRCRRRRRNRELADKRHARWMRRKARKWTAEGMSVIAEHDGFQVWGTKADKALVDLAAFMLRSNLVSDKPWIVDAQVELKP